MSQHEELAPEDTLEDKPATLFTKMEIALIKEEDMLEHQEHPSTIFLQVAELTGETFPSDEHIHELIQVEGNQCIPDDVITVNRLPYHNVQVYIPDIPSIKLHLLQLYHDSLIAGHLGQS